MDNVHNDLKHHIEQALNEHPLSRDNALNWLQASRQVRNFLKEIEKESKDIIDAHTEEIARNKANRA